MPEHRNTATKSRETLAATIHSAADVKDLNGEQLKQSARGVIQMLAQGLVEYPEGMRKLSIIAREAESRHLNARR